MLGLKKPVATLLDHREDRRLKPTLSWPHLIAMGVGAIVGTGIYTLIGVGADLAGPAVMVSFAIAGAVCAFTALCYAELATALPAAGSAYTYSYVAMGETVAWVVGWSLVLEYTVVCSAVATGWSGYAAGLLNQLGFPLPDALLHSPFHGGIMDLPAVVISLVVTGLLLLGARESATVNLLLVGVKLVALAVFIGIAIFAIKPENFHPFAPYGIGDPLDFSEGKKGIMAAAAIIFFAFYGFDTVSTSAEDAKNPGRDLVIGIVGSMVLCTIIYMAVAACAVGALPFQQIVPAVTKEPLALVLRTLGHPLAASLIAGAAVVALPTVILVFMFGQTRIFFVMARDGLLPESWSRVSGKSGAPVYVTLIVGVIVAAISGLFDLGDLASVANAGTLAAFIAVGASVLVLRKTHSELSRVFRTPAVWVVAPLAIVGCLYLFISLKLKTIGVFFAWNALGLAVYFLYSRARSRLRKA